MQAIISSTGTKLYMQSQYIQFILQPVLILKNTKLHLIFVILYQVENYFFYVYIREHMHTLPDLIASICTNTVVMRLLIHYVK